MVSLSELLQSMMQRAGIGTLTLSKLTGIPRSSIENWREGTAQRPKHWRPLLLIARVLMLEATEVETLLTAAGYPALATLGRDLCLDDPDWPYLQPWLPALTTGAAPPLTSACHQLRAPIGDFVGRENEIAQVRAALLDAASGGVAAITGVQGMGGIGKTELAYKVAQHVRDDFPDAQIVLTLRGASLTPVSPEQALQTVIRAFTPDSKLPEDLHALQTLYRSQLDTKRVLILADDAHSTTQVEPLLPPAGSALLVTSRHRFALPAMITIDLDQLPVAEATHLLRSICPRLLADEAAALARACGFLPLALRVAASLLRATPALAVADYLNVLVDERQRLTYLRDPDDPQRDVAATLALSYIQLDSAAQAVFRQLGVFVADFAPELAQAVVMTPTGENVTVLLHHLLRRNLIMYDSDRARWQLHDLVRDLARQLLDTAGEVDATHWRYARVAVQVAQGIQEQYLAGGNKVLWALSQFDTERPHIDAARHWAQHHTEMPEGDQLLLDVARATRDIGGLRYDQRQEIIPLWECVRTATQRMGDRAEEARALSNLGIAYGQLGELHTAIGYLEQCLAIVREIGDRCSEGKALNNLGIAYLIQGNLHTAISYQEQALAIAREIGDRRSEGKTLGNLGHAYTNLGEPSKAISYQEQALAIAREMGDRYSENITLGNLGHPYVKLGEPSKAIGYQEQALAIAREMGDRRGEGNALSDLGLAFAKLGELHTAISYYEQSLAIAREIGERHGEGIILSNLGNTYTDLGNTQSAIDTCTVAHTIAQTIGDRWLEGYAVSYLARAQAIQGDIAPASNTYTQALTLFQEVGDRWGEAECNRLFGLALAQHGERDRALPLLRASVAYEQEIGHVKAEEHAALITRLEAGEPLPPELHVPTNTRSGTTRTGQRTTTRDPESESAQQIALCNPVITHQG